jgi:hypothetical protein
MHAGTPGDVSSDIGNRKSATAWEEYDGYSKVEEG